MFGILGYSMFPPAASHLLHVLTSDSSRIVNFQLRVTPLLPDKCSEVTIQQIKWQKD